jgi:hypothetical protein
MYMAAATRIGPGQGCRSWASGRTRLCSTFLTVCVLQSRFELRSGLRWIGGYLRRQRKAICFLWLIVWWMRPCSHLVHDLKEIAVIADRDHLAILAHDRVDFASVGCVLVFIVSWYLGTLDLDCKIWCGPTGQSILVSNLKGEGKKRLVGVWYGYIIWFGLYVDRTYQNSVQKQIICSQVDQREPFFPLAGGIWCNFDRKIGVKKRTNKKP